MVEHDLIFSIILVLIPVIAISIIGYKTIAYSRKQHERTSIIDIFHMLNDPKHKSAEENIIHAYKENRLMSLQHIVTAYNDLANVVKRNYDQIGVLIDEDLIPRVPYYLTFGARTVESYRVLYDEIKNRRRLEKGYFMARFHNLAIDCLNYWHDNELQKVHPITDPKTNQEIQKDFFGKKIKLPASKKKWL